MILILVAAFLVLLPVGAAQADQATLACNWGPTAGTAHHDQYLPFNFRWDHSGSTTMGMRIVVLNHHQKVLAQKQYDAQANKWWRIRVRCVWAKGRYTVKVYGHDAEGDTAFLYPYRTHFVIY
jgi:hypothetical protein